nr:unnamed protein product [Callosobruchus analis]
MASVGMGDADSMDDDVFVDDNAEGADVRLRVTDRKPQHASNTPSPTGYRNYQPPAEVLKLADNADCLFIEDEPVTILLGDSGVGKTSLLVKFDTGKFQSGNFSATVGIGFTVSTLDPDLISSYLQGTISY